MDTKPRKLDRNSRGALSTWAVRRKGRPVAEPTIGFQLRRLPWEPTTYHINREEKTNANSEE